MAINDVMRNLDRFERKVERIIDIEMGYAGEGFQKNARTSGNYNDDTGALRASVGYTLLTSESLTHSFPTDGIKGTAEGKRQGSLLGRTTGQEIVSKLTKYGVVLSLLAAMPYGKYVEAKGYEVISNSVTKARSDFDRRIKKSLRVK